MTDQQLYISVTQPQTGSVTLPGGEPVPAAVSVSAPTKFAVSVGGYGPTGPAGGEGPPGADGTDGSTGTRGSEWFMYGGAGIPHGLTGMIEGDDCLRFDGEVFKYIGGAWVDQGINLSGGGSGGGGTLVFEQFIASTVWTIPHGLGSYPPVFTVDSSGSPMIGDVDYPDLDNATVTFGYPEAGKAYLAK